MNLSNTNKTLKILLVEDDEVDREHISRTLIKSLIPLKIVESDSSIGAQKLLQNIEFDCAIIDYQLPDTQGSELIDAIQQHRKLPTPIIMVSGNSSERIIADVMRDGVFDYLPKRDLGVAELKNAILAGLIWAEEEYKNQVSRTRFYQLAEGLPQFIWTCLPSGECDFINRRWCEYTGLSRGSQLGYGWAEQIHPEDRPKVIPEWQSAVTTGNELTTKFRVRRADGEYRWFDTRATPQRNDKGDIIRWLGSNTDITDIELTRQALTESEQHFHAIFDYAPLGMAIVNIQGDILEFNPALQKLLGYEASAAAQLNGLAQLNIFNISHNQTRAGEQEQLIKLKDAKVDFVQYETCYIHRNKQEIPALASVAIINRHGNEPRFLFQISDLSERKHYENKLIQLAHFDPLTGLKNRTKLNEDIDYLIQKSNRGSAPFALLFADLDNFKKINDSLGHEAGDLLLKTVARRLDRTLRREDSVARIGGDEFIILLHDVKKYEAVATVAEKLIQRISRPIRINQHKVHVGISFGIALYPTDGDDSQTLLRNADSALYDAKAKGRGNYQLYRKELTEYVHSRLLLETDLRKAINSAEFELYYQPIVDLNNHSIMSVEALIRWHHPTRGCLVPDDFIPYARENGFMEQLGEWVINEAASQAAEWQRLGTPLTISININIKQFHDGNLVNFFTQILTKHSLNPQYLILEITEQLLQERTQDHLTQLKKLKALGFQIAMDEVGLGYASLNFIARIAPEYLKIDRSLIHKINESNEHNTLIATLIKLNKIMPLRIVGVGVEDNTQLAFLQEQQCDLIQGNLFSPPLPAAQAQEHVKNFKISSLNK